MMTIRLAENFRAVFYAPFYAMRSLGFFEREGVEVEFVASSVPGDAVAALLDGTIDLTWGGPMRVMKAHDQRPDSPLVCFGEVVARDPFYLIGRADIDRFELRDLARLRVATVSEVPTPWMCLQHDLRLAGVDPAGLARVADRSMAENLTALREGRLDVAQLFEPHVTTALCDGWGRILHAASARGPCVYTSFIASRERIAREPAAFAAVERATARVQAWLAANAGAELAAAAAAYFPDIAPQHLGAALERYRVRSLWSATPAVSREGFARLADSLVSGGFLSQPPDYATCVEESLEAGPSA